MCCEIHLGSKYYLEYLDEEVSCGCAQLLHIFLLPLEL